MESKFLAGKELVGLSYRRYKNGHYQTCILAKCKCGKIREYRLTYLRTLKREMTCRLCNLNRKSQLEDITNQKIHKLFAQRYLGNTQWEIKCDCGNICYMTSSQFRSEKRKSCGCIRKKK